MNTKYDISNGWGIWNKYVNYKDLYYYSSKSRIESLFILCIIRIDIIHILYVWK